jgi:hypothetical protein
MLSILLILGILAFVAWPYYTVYRLDQALLANDQGELERLLDLEAIRRHYKELLDLNIEGLAERFDNPVFRFFRGGVKEVGGAAFASFDCDWVCETVRAAQLNSSSRRRRPVLGGFSFACFETPTRFLIRAGELGKNPVHLYLTLQQWQWRVTAVFV